MAFDRNRITLEALTINFYTNSQVSKAKVNCCLLVVVFFLSIEIGVIFNLHIEFLLDFRVKQNILQLSSGAFSLSGDTQKKTQRSFRFSNSLISFFRCLLFQHFLFHFKVFHWRLNGSNCFFTETIAYHPFSHFGTLEPTEQNRLMYSDLNANELRMQNAQLGSDCANVGFIDYIQHKFAD